MFNVPAKVKKKTCAITSLKYAIAYGYGCLDKRGHVDQHSDFI